MQCLESSSSGRSNEVPLFRGEEGGCCSSDCSVGLATFPHGKGVLGPIHQGSEEKSYHVDKQHTVSGTRETAVCPEIPPLQPEGSTDTIIIINDDDELEL